LTFDWLVCEDLGDEFADFVGVDAQTGRVVFVHAKHSKDKHQIGASALYDVCGQAVKNLEFLRFGTPRLPGSPQKWNGVWKISKKGQGEFKVKTRIRGTSKTAKELRDSIISLLSAPNTKREAWLVLGGILSKKALEQAIQKHAFPPELLQCFYLVISTYSACKSVGVDLRLFCDE
jgi:hypothetical protein